MMMPITLRPAEPDDETFLYDLYASTRIEELAAWGWDDAQRQAFLHLQFRAQRAHYAGYPNPDDRIVLWDEARIGRLFLSRLEREIRLVDITLTPAYRARGIGAALLRDVCDEAVRTGRAVQLHVEKSNPAQHLYARLGFEIAGDAASHWLLRWQAEPRTPDATGD